MKKVIKILIALILVVIAIVAIFFGIKMSVLPKLNQEHLSYVYYSKLDLYKNAVVDQIPNYVLTRRLKLKDNAETQTPFIHKELEYKSKIKVKENQLSYNFVIDTEKEASKTDILDASLILLKDKTNTIEKVFKCTDGFLVYYYNEKGKYAFIEKYNNSFESLWTYKVDYSNKKIDYMEVKDYIEFENKYYFIFDFTYKDVKNTSDTILVLNVSGKKVAEKETSDYCDNIVNIDNRRIYIDGMIYIYYDIDKNEVVEDYRNFTMPNEPVVSYKLIGIKNGIYYFLSIISIPEEANKYSEEVNYILYKTDNKGNILNKINVIKNIDSNYKMSEYEYSIYECYFNNNDIAIKWDAMENNTGVFDGLMILDANLNVVKNISTNKNSNEYKKLLDDRIYSVDYVNILNDKVYVTFGLDYGGPLYVIYNNKGGVLFSKEYNDLYASVGAVSTEYFTDDEIMTFEEYEANNKKYIKLVKLKYNS